MGKCNNHTVCQSIMLQVRQWSDVLCGPSYTKEAILSSQEKQYILKNNMFIFKSPLVACSNCDSVGKKGSNMTLL